MPLRFRTDGSAGGTLIAFSAGALVLLALSVLFAHAAVGHVDGFDAAVLMWSRAQTGDSGTLVSLARGVTAMGNDTTLWIVTLIVAGYLLAAGRMTSLVHLLGTTAGGGLLTSGIKAIVDRPRPTVVIRLVETSSASFPSGHAMNSAFVYGTLAMLAARATPTARARRYVLAVAVLLSMMIGASRIVLGVHWPSDVLAGWTLGGAWALVGARAAPMFERRQDCTAWP